MTDAEELYHAVKSAILDAAEEQETPPAFPMMATEPFAATDEDDRPVRVLGIIDAGEDLKWVVADQESDGSIVPVMCSRVWRRAHPKLETAAF